MKFNYLTILSLIVLTLSINSCKKDTCNNGVKDGTETGVNCGGDCSPCPVTKTVVINGETKTIVATQAELSNQFSASINFEQKNGLGLGVTYTMSDNSFLSVGFYNDDVNANCLNLGIHETSLENAFDANVFKYAKVLVINSNGNYFSDGNVSDIVKLIQCDRTNKKFSAEFSATVENNATGESFVVSGDFTDLSYTVTF